MVVTDSGLPSAGKGEPATGVSAPVVPSIVYAETDPGEFAVYASHPPGPMRMH